MEEIRQMTKESRKQEQPEQIRVYNSSRPGGKNSFFIRGNSWTKGFPIPGSKFRIPDIICVNL